MNRARSLLPLVALASCMACSPCCEREREVQIDRRSEPEIRRVVTGKGPETTEEVDNAFNVLFLGDGFTGAEQLETYRAVVQHLARGLIARPPFCNYAERIGFLRIDVDDPTGTIDRGECTADLEPIPSLAGPGLVDPIEVAGSGPWQEDLGVTASGGCRLLWLEPAGQQRAFDLAAIAPAVSVIVVVANTTLPAGGGYQQPATASTGLMVLGVPVDEGGTLAEQAHLLFAHELGHTLGLYDEYGDQGVDALSDPPAPFVSAPNVWRPVCGPPWSSAVAAMPWAQLLPTGCKPHEMVDCRAVYDTAAADPCPLPQTPPRCVYVSSEPSAAAARIPCPGLAVVPASLAVSSATCVNQRCETAVGAWEGAYYHDHGYFRAAGGCRMERLAADVPFCEACARALHELLCDAGAPTTPPCPPAQGAAVSCF